MCWRATRAMGRFAPSASGPRQLIPLPERLYPGGPTSLRGFSFNAAGPRDPETGFPIGGAGALVNSTELRLPPPTLPWLGNTVSFVLFHDMGNVFTNAGDAWAAFSAFTSRIAIPAKCLPLPRSTAPEKSFRQVRAVRPTARHLHRPAGNLSASTTFPHAPGFGLRYHTPIGPIRLDFSYNLNPPIYPVNIDYSIGYSTANPLGPYSTPHVGEASHFNFFFSLGQTF